LEEYLNNKRTLFSKYDWISVEVSDIQYIPKGTNMVVSYYQHYNSPNYESWGRNKLYFRKRNGKVDIFKEQFSRDNYEIK
jgi:hypothetical protein